MQRVQMNKLRLSGFPGGFAAFLAVAFLIACAAISPARAGGLYIQEFATPSQGTAGAGAAARDASAALHNPAGMTRLDGHQAMAGER